MEEVSIKLTQDELKILFAILTKEKFVLIDAQAILPIAKKLQDNIKVEPKIEPQDHKKPNSVKPS